MTGDEFRAARVALGISAAQLAHILDVSPRTVNRWEDGTRDTNPTAAQVMRWMTAGWRPPEWPENPKS